MKVALKPAQWTVFRSQDRFRILAAGRRFGKTFLALTELCQAAWGPNRLAWYVAPTYRQAKRIAWKALRQMTKQYWATRPNESDLRIELITGGTIALRGADNYDSLRGDGLDFVVLDEYASMAPEAWTEVLRPALSDKLGRALFIGTPKGMNHFHDLYQAGRTQPDWRTFRYTTEEGGNVPVRELEAAARELDERTYRQEFQASFENLTEGLVYYAFDRAENLRRLEFDPKLSLFWSLDFNIHPMCSVVGQRIGDQVFILDELVLPDSNTVAACEEFLERTAEWVGRGFRSVQLNIYGDATGDSRRSSAPRTDWQIVRDFLSRYTNRFRTSFHIASSNPKVRDRVNCVNAKLCSQAGMRTLFIDPRCKQLIQDLERVQWKQDGNGNMLHEIDKSDPARTHVSDALGYMISREFGMRPAVGYRSEWIL